MAFIMKAISVAGTSICLIACGGSGSSNETPSSVSEQPATTAPVNNPPSCNPLSWSNPRGNGTISIVAALNCTDSDGDSLSYSRDEIQTSEHPTGTHNIAVVVSDGEDSINVDFQYVITNQAPKCIQIEVPIITELTEAFEVLPYISCTDENADAFLLSITKIDVTGKANGVYQQQISVTDDELSTAFVFDYEISIAEPPNLSRCDVIKASVARSNESDVSVTCDENYAYIGSDTYPSHDLMNGITATNEQIPVPAVNYAAPIMLRPSKAAAPTTIDAALGVAINGVPIYDYSAAGELDLYNYDANVDTLVLGQLDHCGGHAGRGDDYHYHAAPTCMMDSIENRTDDTVLGWGYDGYPLYGFNNPDGSTIQPGDLELCNGQLDETFGYRYHLSVEAPYVFQCLVGEIDNNILPRVAPLKGGNDRADLKPPPGDVQNLRHVIEDNGTRMMSYDYQGEHYYVRYSPSISQANCWEFEMKTISNNGVVQAGTYCR